MTSSLTHGFDSFWRKHALSIIDNTEKYYECEHRCRKLLLPQEFLGIQLFQKQSLVLPRHFKISYQTFVQVQSLNCLQYIQFKSWGLCSGGLYSVLVLIQTLSMTLNKTPGIQLVFLCAYNLRYLWSTWFKMLMNHLAENVE